MMMLNFVIRTEFLSNDVDDLVACLMRTEADASGALSTFVKHIKACLHKQIARAIKIMYQITWSRKLRSRKRCFAANVVRKLFANIYFCALKRSKKSMRKLDCDPINNCNYSRTYCN